MSKKLIVISSFLFTLWSCANAQKVVPTVKDVLDKFYSTYELPGDLFVNFEKRKNQWTLLISTYDQLFTGGGKKYLFYDTTTQKYQPISLALKNDSTENNKRETDFDIMKYQIHDFYGYRGWYKDVIADLANKKELTDSSLYSLARAYSAYASSLLRDQNTDAVIEEMFNFPMTENCMTETQRTKYRSIEQSAIKTFARLKKQNNKFQTFVGSVDIKYANEVMVEFYTYLTYSKKNADSLRLPDNLYPDSILDKSIRVLNACPKNSILLSLGDNDLYSLLYVQQKMSFRRDVYLINMSLLGLDRYIFTASKPQFDSKPIKYSASLKTFQDRTNDYVLLDKAEATLPFSSISSLLEKKSKADSVLTLPTSSFYIKRNIASNSTPGQITFSTTSQYLYKNEWILLDILNNLNGRNICCQFELFDNCAPLNKYFSKVGDIYIY